MSSAWKITLQKTNSVLLHECSLTFTREIFVNCELPKTNTSTHPTTLTHTCIGTSMSTFIWILLNTQLQRKKNITADFYLGVGRWNIFIASIILSNDHLGIFKLEEDWCNIDSDLLTYIGLLPMKMSFSVWKDSSCSR